MRTNIRQVAAMAGVSRTTVSNVLLGKDGKITPGKRAEVLRAVEKLGYVPVRPFLQNRIGETRVVAIATCDPLISQNEFLSRVHGGVCEAALRHDYDVLTVLRAQPDWAVNRTAVRLLDRRSDGVVFLPPYDQSNTTLQALVEHGIPAVATYQREVPEGIAWVDPDNAAAIQGMLDLLVSSGHRRIAHLTYQVDQFDFRERKRAFIEATARMGLAMTEGGVVEAVDNVTPDVAGQVLATGATAVLCANDLLAVCLWSEFERMGLRVPDDMSITGIDDEHQSPRSGLTTMQFSYSELGRIAFESLIGLISGKNVAECCHIVAPQLVERHSVKRI